MPTILEKLALMSAPWPLRRSEHALWSGGRGDLVWRMLTAAAGGDVSGIAQLLDEYPALVACQYAYITPLRLATRENHLDAVELLIARGASLENIELAGLRDQVRMRGHHAVADYLEGLLQDRYGVGPGGEEMAQAIRDFDLAALDDHLAQHPTWVHAADGRGNRPLHWAALTRQRAVVDRLLDHGADLDAQRPDGARPIDLTYGDYHYRSWYRDLPPHGLQRHEWLIGYLVASGARYDISVAAKTGDYARVRELLDVDPALANRAPDHGGYYSGLPLRCAAGRGHRAIVELLLDRGANPNEPEPGIAPRGGALHSAIGGRHFEIAELLLDRGADPNAPVESSGNCMLMARHVNAPAAFIERLAAAGGSFTPELACYGDDVVLMAAMLLANPQLPLDEYTLREAFAEPRKRVAGLILRNQPEAIRGLPVRAKSAAHARWLLDHGASATQPDWLGATPLHHAAAAGSVDVARLLLEEGVPVNALESDTSSTPLGWAARAGHAEMVQLLLSFGADPHLPSDEAWAQPLAWAQRQGHSAIAALLT